MYLVIVLVSMLIAPLVSIAAAIWLGHDVLGARLVVTWYVFWAVGVRLSLAGLRQMVQPSYTAQVILGIKGEDALVLVRELGFANCALGSIGLASLLIPTWCIPAGVAGAIFYGFAGINHVTQRNRSAQQTLAMGSDLFAALLLAVCIAQR